MVVQTNESAPHPPPTLNGLFLDDPLIKDGLYENPYLGKMK